MDDKPQLSRFLTVYVIGSILVASGVCHLAWLFWTGAPWDGPVSLRKPGLFGISAGMTIWSIAWGMTQLKPLRLDAVAANVMAGSLLIEVGLITMQFWRGVPSHFNRATRFDASVEAIMFGLIVFVTVGIAWLSWRSLSLPPMNRSRSMAIQAGLWFLLVSCLLGFAITIAGEMNLVNGRPPEIWGQAGVLKYPHGAILHAIQTLPILSALLHRFKIPGPNQLLLSAILSHIFFLSHSLWQTSQGHARWDLDLFGGFTLCVAIALIAVPATAIGWHAINLTKIIRRTSSDNYRL